MTIIEGKRSIFVATPAQFIEEDIETAWAGAEEHIVIRDGFSWILGRYVEADNFNTNGHLFPLDDLKTSHLTIANTPLNIGHQRQYIVGHYPASALVYPTAAETVGAAVDAATAGVMTHPYVEALAAMWKGLFPEEYKKAKRAQENGSLYFSMESRPKSFTCMTDGGCGLTYDYDGPQSETYCAELNQPRSRKRMNKNTFMGGALIIPPMRPGWRRADITEISALVQEHAEQAEQLYDDITAVGDITAEMAEDLMLRLLAGAYGFVPEVIAPKADQARGRGAEGDDPRASGMWSDPGPGPSTADLDVASLLAVELAAHSGVIVAMVPPPEVAEALAALGDEVPEQIHVTICFLGQTGEDDTLSGRTVDEVSAALAAFAAGAPPIGEVKISGLGHFALDDGSEVTYASVDAPALPEFRARLVAALKAAGVPVDREHGSSPHVSLSYTAPGAGPTEMPPSLSWMVDSVELWWGDARRRSFRLAGGEVPFSG